MTFFCKNEVKFGLLLTNGEQVWESVISIAPNALSFF